MLTDQTVDTLGCVEGLGCTADRSDCGHVGLGLCGRTGMLTDQTMTHEILAAWASHPFIEMSRADIESSVQ